MSLPPQAPANILGLDDPAFAELIEAACAGSLILCAGPGVSAAAGLPGRTRLLEVLLKRARARGASAEALGEIEDLAGRGQRIEALSAAKAALGEGEFGAVSSTGTPGGSSPGSGGRGAGSRGSCRRARQRGDDRAGG